MIASFPEKLEFLFRPSRFKVAYGGRGGAKSWGFARALLLLGVQRKMRILCTREFQNSIQESVHQVLTDQITALKLDTFYQHTKTAITGANGTEFIFAGLKTDPHKVKSTEGVDICWVEEAEKVSKASWDMLIPTIRNDGSEIWVSFNPDEETDPTYQMFCGPNGQPDAVVVKIGWEDNPWFPDVLRQAREHLAATDPDGCDHIYGGQPKKHSAARVLNGKYVISAFVPVESGFDGVRWDGPYLGADWGFANDPTVLTKSWIYDQSLYVEHEFWGVGKSVDIDVLPDKFAKIPEATKHVIRADNSRPETISYLQTHGFPKIEAAEKWPGSVEDGIAFLRSFVRIVIHPRCVHTSDEARLWSYKIDRLTGDVLPTLAPGNDHCWDSIRYALQPIIRRAGKGFFAGRNLE